MTKTLLHLGCGHNRASIGGEEIRVDFDPRVEPDVLGPVDDLAWRESSSVDVILAQHILEHLEPTAGDRALREWLRVLNDDGYAIVAVPDLRAVAAEIARGGEDKALVAFGPHAMNAMDIIFGPRRLMPDDLGQRHAWGFTDRTLARALEGAGFASIAIRRDAELKQLVAVATKTGASREHLLTLFPVSQAVAA